jgi:hypothetical protein
MNLLDWPYFCKKKSPPLMHILSFMPHFVVDINETKPLLNACPNSLCKPASVGKVGGGILRLIAKFTIHINFVSLTSKYICRPHSILKH